MIFEELKLSKAAAADHIGILKHPGRADRSMFTHPAEMVLPIFCSALRSQGHPCGKHSQILRYRKGARVLWIITAGKVIIPPILVQAFPSAKGLHSA